MSNRFRFVALIVFLVLTCCFASAQAWTPRKGEGYVTITFADSLVKDHFTSDGSRLDIGHIRSLAVIPEFDCGLNDHWAATFALPVVTAKYYGPDPHQLPHRRRYLSRRHAGL